MEQKMDEQIEGALYNQEQEQIMKDAQRWRTLGSLD